jgi:hypothetical protein
VASEVTLSAGVLVFAANIFVNVNQQARQA